MITDQIPDLQEVIWIEEEDKKSILCTFGNQSLFQGPPKSRKTMVISFIAAALIKSSQHDSVGSCLKFKARLPDKKKVVLYFETEQGNFHLRRVQNRIYDLAGLPKDSECQYIKFFQLKPHTNKERAKIVEYVINNEKNVGFVIIDGSRDLVVDYNDAGQSIEIVNLLMRLSHKKDIHILNVLHENKQDRNARGHFGAELTNKCESVIRAYKDKENGSYSVIEPYALRDLEFKEFTFGFEDNQPFVVDKKQRIRMSTPSQIDDQTHKNLIKEIFKDQKEYSKTYYYKIFKIKQEQFNLGIGDHKIREYTDYHIEKEFIKDVGGDSKSKLIMNF